MTVSIGPAAATHSTTLRSRAQAEAYVIESSFRYGPPRLLGLELEWTVHHCGSPRKPLDTDTLIAALGEHAPTALVATSPHVPLPHGSTLTLEPGGQVEVSSPPVSSMKTLFDVVARDAAYVRRRLRQSGLELGDQGTDPWRPPRRVLRVPRYAAMEAAFDRIGEDGRVMMCSTAGVQVCLDAGETGRAAARWEALHALGPLMVATFANSPRVCGARTGWASTRTRALLGTDPPRTRPGPICADPAAAWARRILDTAVLCLRRNSDDWSAPTGLSFAEWISGGLPTPPTVGDLEYHLTTVFPPVRPRGYYEVRYLDAQPGQDWILPCAALIALFQQESTVDRLRELTAPAASRWVHAACRGLADSQLARSARPVFELACRGLEAVDDDLPARLADAVDRRLASVTR